MFSSPGTTPFSSGQTAVDQFLDTENVRVWLESPPQKKQEKQYIRVK